MKSPGRKLFTERNISPAIAFETNVVAPSVTTRGRNANELDDRLVGRDRVRQYEQSGERRQNRQQDQRELARELRHPGLPLHDSVSEPEREHQGDHDTN